MINKVQRLSKTQFKNWKLVEYIQVDGSGVTLHLVKYDIVRYHVTTEVTIPKGWKLSNEQQVNLLTFFSGTDIGHLHSQSPDHNYFLSLIVNFACEPIAKVAFASTRKLASSSSFSFRDDEGNIQFQEDNSNKEEDITVVFNCDVFVEIEPKLLDRIDELKEAKKNRYKQFTNNWNTKKQNYIHTDFDWEKWKAEQNGEGIATVWDTEGKRLNATDIQTEFDFSNHEKLIADSQIEYFTKCLLADTYNDYEKTVELLVEDRNACVDTNAEARQCCMAMHMMYDSVFHDDTYFTEVMTKVIALLGKYKSDFTTKMISIIKQELKEYVSTEL